MQEYQSAGSPTGWTGSPVMNQSQLAGGLPQSSSRVAGLPAPRNQHNVRVRAQVLPAPAFFTSGSWQLPKDNCCRPRGIMIKTRTELSFGEYAAKLCSINLKRSIIPSRSDSYIGLRVITANWQKNCCSLILIHGVSPADPDDGRDQNCVSHGSIFQRSCIFRFLWRAPILRMKSLFFFENQHPQGMLKTTVSWIKKQ